MLNLGGQGMGTSGLGIGGGGMGGGGGGMSLQQILAMLQAGQPSGGGMGAPGMATPLQPGGAPTPMANYIGGAMHPGGSPGMNGMPMAPVAANPAPAAAPAGGGMGNLAQLLPLIAAMKGQQSGVAPQPGVNGQMAPGAGNPTLDAFLRSMGMYGGMTGGAPT